MKITAINVFQVDLPLKEGRYSWSNGNFVEVFDSTVVEIETTKASRAMPNAARSGLPTCRVMPLGCGQGFRNWRPT